MMKKTKKTFFMNQKIDSKNNKKFYLKSFYLFFLIIGFLASCNQNRSFYSTPSDNTAKNKQDIAGGPLTPEDQSGSKSDVELTQKIRSNLIQEDTLSVNAHNVKIITLNGIVTLRGPVNNNDEKEKVFLKAQEVAGINKVINQLEIVSQ